jgi:hypothetical protein
MQHAFKKTSKAERQTAPEGSMDEASPGRCLIKILEHTLKKCVIFSIYNEHYHCLIRSPRN